MTLTPAPVTGETIREIVSRELEKDRRVADLFAQVEKILVKFDGKPLNRRIQTAVKQAFPAATVCWEIIAGISLRIYGGEFSTVAPSYNDYVTIRLSKAWDNQTFSLEIFREENRWVLAAGQRNEKRVAFLAGPMPQEIANNIASYRMVQSVLEAYTDGLPDGYRLKALWQEKRPY